MIKKTSKAQKRLYPSILTESVREAQTELLEISEIPGIDIFQIDVLDGQFADNLTVTPADLAELNFDKEKIDLHLMVEEPLDYVYETIDYKHALPVRAIIAQVERMSHQRPFIDEVRKHEWQVGLSLDLYTPLDAIDDASWEDINIVQLMGIEAGFQGQEFHQSVLFKIQELRDFLKKHKLSPEVVIDGGVKFDNIQPLLDAGADSVAVGSGLWKSQSSREAAVKFLSLLDQDN